MNRNFFAKLSLGFFSIVLLCTNGFADENYKVLAFSIKPIDINHFERERSIPENLTTWIFEDGTFIPQAKLQGDKSYSIITDHLGTPTEAYNEEGQKVWSRELGIYGQTRKETGLKNFVP